MRANSNSSSGGAGAPEDEVARATPSASTPDPTETGPKSGASMNAPVSVKLLPWIARGPGEGVRGAGSGNAGTGAEVGTFGALADALPTMVWATDGEGNCTFLNARWLEFTGQTLAEGLGAGWLDAVHPDDRERSGGVFAAAVAQREPFRLEYRVRRYDGAYRWMIDAGQPRVGAAGTLEGYIGSLIDITERKQAEEEARHAAERFQFALDAARLGDWGWDAATDTVTLSSRAAQILGCEPRTTWTGLRASLHPEDRERVKLAVDVAAAERKAYDIEYRVGARGGRWTWVASKGRGHYTSDGALLGMSGLVQDITEQKRNEELVREGEVRLQLATKSGKFGIWDWDIERNEVVWTDSLYEIHGLKRGAGPLAAEAFVALVHPDDRAPVQRAIESSLTRATPYELEFRAVRPGGAVVWLYTQARVLRDGEVAKRMLGATFDITARKHAELALRDSEARFRALASHAPVGIFLTDANGDALFVNDAWQALSGLTPELARGRGWTKALHPDDRAAVADEWDLAVQQRRPFQLEYRFVRPDGVVHWLQGSAVAYRTAAGGLQGYIGTVADLTQRKAAEEQLRAREAQFRLITTNAPIILAHCDREGRYLFVNRAYTDRFEVTAGEVIGRTIQEVLGPKAYAVLKPYVDQVLSGRRADFEIDIPYRAVGRRFMHVSYVPDLGEDGTVRGWLAAIADITDRKQMEDALRQTEARFRQLADSMPQIVFAADAQGRADYYNRRWYELTGAKEGVTGDDSFVPILHPDDRRRCLEKWYASIASGEPYEMEYRFRFPARDEYRWHLARALPARDAEGKIVRWFGTCTDIHDWKLVQEELRTAQTQLQAHADELEHRVAERTASLREAVAQMEEFSYSVSHDLRAPLRAMNAYAQALVEDYGKQLDETARSYLERIQRSSVRMEKLTHDVLTYSRVARAEAELRAIDLDALIRDVVLQYRELQAPAALVEVVAPFERVRGHEVSLGQCLANLMTNAVKFVARGVTPRIVLRTETTEGHVRLWIEDNGIGIAPEYQARLFRVFERVPTREAYEGTGIGLAIVRKAVEKMGGTCGVVSDGRSGSRFWIELPKA